MFKTFFVFLLTIIVVVSFANSIPVPQDISDYEDDPSVVCKQQMKRGQCRALIPRWMYDIKKGACVEFKYGGCGGNSNNFKTKTECESLCSGIRK